MVHSDGILIETIWKCREILKSKDGKWCILMVFETAMRKTVHVLT